MSRKEVITCDICHKKINPPLQYQEVHHIKIKRPKSIKVLFGYTDRDYDKIWYDESDICEECNDALLKKWDEVVKERRSKQNDRRTEKRRYIKTMQRFAKCC